MEDEESGLKKKIVRGRKETPFRQYVIDSQYVVVEMKKELDKLKSNVTSEPYKKLLNKKSAHMSRVKLRIKEHEVMGHVQDPKGKTKQVM